MQGYSCENIMESIEHANDSNGIEPYHEYEHLQNQYGSSVSTSKDKSDEDMV